MYNPVATYRVQLHSEFTFAGLMDIIEYLKQLGVTTVYASPIFKAVAGSTHGYDGLDPNRINPEIGSLLQLKEISAKLKLHNMGWLQDIVPNHMAFHPANGWLMDVLENGESSSYYSYFDLQPGGKIMVPFLGCSLEDALEKNELKLVMENGKQYVKYYDSRYPLRQDSVAGEDLETINDSRELLSMVLDQQHYRLCHWQETDWRINYRRFFTVNGLICMNMQDRKVFHNYHQLIKELLEEKVFQGLRVDHVDGLYDPGGYIRWLRELAGDETYLVVEKILGKEESLPAEWPLEGNTGYDFLALVNNLLTDKAGEKELSRFYYSIAKNKGTIPQQAREKKALILHGQMRGELDNLTNLFMQLAGDQEVSADSVRAVISALLVNFPVYRFYGSTMTLAEEEKSKLNELFRLVGTVAPENISTIHFMRRMLTSSYPDDNGFAMSVAHFYNRLMQFAGPLMAKGVEDTLMYTFNRLISRNEVGDSPGSFGIGIGEFHQLMTDRRENYPLSINTTATHDTKRGEDARARLNVLSSVHHLWTEKIRSWMQMNAHLKTEGAPDANDEYLIYQSLLGSWPFLEAEAADFAERFTAYLEKALREAKVHSNWTTSGECYENAVKSFALALLDKNGGFWKSFTGFFHVIAGHGIVNSLSQLILKFTTPGIPDVYQGGELWDLSFVDPDNRRPVDYRKRHDLLEKAAKTPIDELWKSAFDGRIKLLLTQRLFEIRKEYREILEGEYIPLDVEGACQEHVLAFARKAGKKMLVVIVPLFTARLNLSVHNMDWKDTFINLPDVESGVNLLTGKVMDRTGKIRITDVFSEIPFAVIRYEALPKERQAGVLLHISSLPSSYGIGDLGPSAYDFVDLLARCGQSIWQLLPVNPVSEGQSYSPYSSTSSMAGNPLFISPDLLVHRGWLFSSDLEEQKDEESDRLDYKIAEARKMKMANKAWRNFQQEDQHHFTEYCLKESYWLEDFAVFTLLKEIHGQSGWNEWPVEWKDRNATALENLRREKKNELDRIKWMQYVFDLQWNDLKEYANSRGVSLIGDLPFYISHDSADVWVNRHLFALDEEGSVLRAAGVPPDAFSDDGQLWGMPVFNWEKMRETNYEWWLHRLRRNAELFDVVRLDHFRAFSAYWVVDASENTAKNGVWAETPGTELLRAIKEQLGSLPFIAEDLGDIDEPVRELRRKFQLPGMKVLQFAFGDDMGRSEFMLHNHSGNFVVYTGTHDNNTMKGWWIDEADERTKKRVKDYAGMEISDDNVAEYFCRLAYSSPSSRVIIPMQDLLGLGSEARMNLPSSTGGNWTWRMKRGDIGRELERNLRKWVRIYGR